MDEFKDLAKAPNLKQEEISSLSRPITMEELKEEKKLSA